MFIKIKKCTLVNDLSKLFVVSSVNVVYNDGSGTTFFLFLRKKILNNLLILLNRFTI